MTSPKLLFLSPFFDPEAISTGKYNSLLVQALVERGVAVDVVCSHPLYPAWKPVRSHKTLHGVTIHRGGGWMRYPRAMLLRRFFFELWFAARVAWTLPRLRLNPQRTVAVFPPSLYFALARRLLPAASHSIGIVHDLQATLGFRSQGGVNGILSRVVHAVERMAFQSCDTLIALSHGMAKRLREDYGVNPERIVVRYPFVTLGSSSNMRDQLSHVLREGVQHVVYAGALGKKQNPPGLFEFFKNAASRLPQAQFHIFSGGPAYQQLRESAASQFVESVHFHDLVAEADLEELYARSTVQVIPQAEGSSEACLPSKLPNILAAGCAVLVVCDPATELAMMIEQTHSGEVANSWNTESLIAKLNKVLDQVGRQTREQRQQQTRKLVLREFSLERLVDVVLGLAKPGEDLFAEDAAAL